MNYHIVRTNEKIEDIAVIYNLDIDEIKQTNKHIRIWENLTPGLKIRLPEISESLALELDDIEPFIEDYYPKLSPLYKEEEILEPQVVQTILENNSNNKKTESKQIINKQQNFYPYQYYYNPYYNYYRYYYNRRKPK